MGLSKGSLSYWVRKKRKSSGKKPSFVELSSLVKPKVGIEASSKHLPADAQAKLPRITYHVPRVTCQVSRARCHELFHIPLTTNHVSRTTCHVSRPTYHVSRPTYHVPRLTSHVPRLTQHVFSTPLISPESTPLAVLFSPGSQQYHP